MFMTILVTGANGQLGSELRLLSRTCPHRYIFTDVIDVPGVETVYLDITDMEAVRGIVARESVDVIVNCAAYTNVDKAEDDVALCDLLNARAPGNLAVAMKERGGLLIHISTDYVFGGHSYNTPCSEEQEGKPTGVYGLTKLHGERNIIDSGCSHVIIRTAWMYSEYGRNFVKTMLNLTATRPELQVVFDQVGTPTYARDLAEAIHLILTDYSSHLEKHLPSHCEERLPCHCEERSDVAIYPRTGIYNYTDEGVCSWYDFAKMIAEYSGHTSCRIMPCHSDEFPSKVKRPAYSVLDKTKIKKTFGLSIPYWTDSLKKCLNILLSL